MSKNVNDIVRRCFSCGKLPAKSLHCGACHLVNYCSATCQKKDWSRHKLCCKKIRPLIIEGESILQPVWGTSDGNPNRMNQEAEQISPQARRLKQGGCFDQAIAMYTRCLELDCYNHLYSFQRAETLYVSYCKLSLYCNHYLLRCLTTSSYLSSPPTFLFTDGSRWTRPTEALQTRYSGCQVHNYVGSKVSTRLVIADSLSYRFDGS